MYKKPSLLLCCFQHERKLVWVSEPLTVARDLRRGCHPPWKIFSFFLKYIICIFSSYDLDCHRSCSLFPNRRMIAGFSESHSKQQRQGLIFFATGAVLALFSKDRSNIWTTLRLIAANSKLQKMPTVRRTPLPSFSPLYNDNNVHVVIVFPIIDRQTRRARAK